MVHRGASQSQHKVGTKEGTAHSNVVNCLLACGFSKKERLSSVLKK